MSSFSPGLILMLGALAVPLLRGHVRSLYMLWLPIAGLLYTISLEPGVSGQIEFLGYTLELVRVDSLSKIFGYIFFGAAALGVLFGLKEQDTVPQAAALIYAGGAISAVFAGDLISLFVFWELTAISSVFLIWARRTERSYRAGMRYLIIQVGSGVILLAGLIIHAADTGSIAFGYLGLSSPGTALILVAFGIKCAFPLLHNWLQDAYPEATVGGTVWLSAFTTKLAVYALARGYPGTEMLIWIGVTMTAFPIFFAVIENDLRRVLAYSLNNQLGFMVTGIGIGTEMALNGTVRTWNRSSERLFGYTAAEAIGQRIDFLFFEQDQLALRDRVIAALASDGFHEETVKGRKKDGAEIYVEARICLLKDADGEAIGLIGCCHDVTEKRALRAELLEITAQEQRRIGQALHDGTGQELTGLNYLAFSHARALTDRRHRNADTAVKIAEGLQRALKQVRALSKGLLPVEVDSDGLMAGLNELTVRMSEVNEVACIFHCKEPIPVLDQEVATQLYRIAQEALTNAIKHGRADTVDVRLIRQDRMLRLEIIDDGIGIPMPKPKGGLGLRIMASRAELIGATLEIEPTSTEGTRVVCSLPWD